MGWSRASSSWRTGWFPRFHRQQKAVRLIQYHRSFDLSGSAVLDCAPRLAIPSALLPVEPPLREIPPGLQAYLAELHETHPQLSPILGILPHLSTVASTVDRNFDDPAFWRNAVGATIIIGPVVRRLLTMPRLSDYAVSEAEFDLLTVQEMVRLACLMLLSAIKGRFGLNTLDMGPLWTKFSRLLSQPLDNIPRQIQQLRLWALMVSGLVQPAEGRAAPLVLSVVNTMAVMGLSSSLDAVNAVKRLVWVGILEEQQVALLAQEIDTLSGADAIHGSAIGEN